MLAVDIIAVGTALISLFSAAIASSCCTRISSRHDTATLERLTEKKDTLVAVLKDIRRKHNGEAVLTRERTSFMNTVDDSLKEVNESITQLEGRIHEKCVCGLLPNLFVQRQAQSRMQQKSVKLNHLIKTAKIISAEPARGKRQQPEVAIVGKKRNEAVEGIWKMVLVAEGGRKIVFIHGTLGVGKTTIASYIHNKALKDEHEELFDYVIWVTLEDGADLWQVQEKLAKSLEIDLRKPDDPASTGDTVERAEKLSELAVLQLHFLNADVFNTYLNMAEQYANVVPPKFNFRVGVVQAGGYVEENSLAISGLSIESGTPVNSKAELNVLSLLKLRYLNVLDVSNFTGLSYLFSAEILGSLTELRELRVYSCVEMVEVVLEPAEEGTICVPQLTKIEFFELPRLKSVCCGQILDCPDLVSIRVWSCRNLKLPTIRSRSNEIQIIGDKSWHDNLKSYGHLNSNFTLAEDSVRACRVGYLHCCYISIGNNGKVLNHRD